MNITTTAITSTSTRLALSACSSINGDPVKLVNRQHTSIMSAPNVLNAVSKFAIPLFVAFSFGQAAIYDVKGGSRAVIFDRISGVQEKVVNEGTHFLIPWLQKAIVYDVRTKPRNISTTTGSKDLQMVSLTLRVLHRPEVTKLPKIYQVCRRSAIEWLDTNH
jgi:hypothetical protein